MAAFIHAVALKDLIAQVYLQFTNFTAALKRNQYGDWLAMHSTQWLASPLIC